jgi:hypothetical protein
MAGPDYKAKIAEFNRKNARETADGLTSKKRASVIKRMKEANIPAENQKSIFGFH